VVFSLDVQVRAQTLDLLADSSARHGLSYLFISDDPSVVRIISDRVLVMKAGEIGDQGETEKMFTNPKHPDTRALIAAAPALPEVAGRVKKRRRGACAHCLCTRAVTERAVVPCQSIPTGGMSRRR